MKIKFPPHARRSPIYDLRTPGASGAAARILRIHQLVADGTFPNRQSIALDLWGKRSQSV